MINYIKYLTLFLLVATLISCSKDDNPPQNETQLMLTASVTEVPTGEEITFNVTADGTTVGDAEILINGNLVTGNAHTFTQTGTYQAVAQKEGHANSEALEINVKDVYVVGYEYNGTIDVAMLWKNGTPQNLTNSSYKTYAHSVYVSGIDVYVVGNEHNGSKYVAKLWKNGTPQDLSDGSNHTYAHSVFVSGGDVYVAGYEHNGTTSVVKVWKNGTAQNLTDGSFNARAYSLYISDNDVYVAGYEDNGTASVAKVWKNGTPTNLTDGFNTAGAYSVYVSGPSTGSGQADVYVAGPELNGTNYVNKLWKNGTPQNLTDASNSARARSVYVSGGDVYVAGHEQNGTNYVAKVWNLPAGEAGNGTPESLSDGSNNAYAFSVYVSDGQ